MRRCLFVFVCAMFLFGCSSGPDYQYFVKPTPLKQKVTQYHLGQVKVKLTSVGYITPGDTTFASGSDLEQTFITDLLSDMKRKNMLAPANESDSPVVDVTIYYTRKVNIGGKSLSKPKVSHQVLISQQGRRLVKFSREQYTTEYSYLEDAAVNLEMAAFLWDAKDEPRDVALISAMIVNDIAMSGN